MIKLLEKMAKPWEMEIVRSMRDRPEEWSEGFHTFDHKSGLELWNSNGFPFYNLYRPFERYITFAGKVLIEIEKVNVKRISAENAVRKMLK